MPKQAVALSKIPPQTTRAKRIGVAMQTAVDGYLFACEPLGQVAEKSASGRLMLRVDPAVHAAALKASACSGQSLNKWAEKALNQAAHAG